VKDLRESADDDLRHNATKIIKGVGGKINVGKDVLTELMDSFLVENDTTSLGNITIAERFTCTTITTVYVLIKYNVCRLVSHNVYPIQRLSIISKT